MKWLLGGAVAAIFAAVAFGNFFDFDFKTLRAEAVSTANAKAADKAASRAANAAVKVDLTPEQEKKAQERTEGNVNAPVQMYEFSSFTCSHCAHFHLNAMPNLQKYIDSGDLVVYFKDIFMDKRAASATLLTRCIADNNAYWKFVKMLFETQNQWAFSMDYEKNLLNYASMQGLDRETAKACMEDKTLLKALVAKRDGYASTFSIMGTPTIILAYDGKTEHINHANDGQYIADKIDEILKAKKSAALNEEKAENPAENSAPVVTETGVAE